MPMPRRNALSSRAPHDFWSSPGETTKAGTRNAIMIQPDSGPVQTLDQSAWFGAAACTASHPPAAESASGTAMSMPTSSTPSCTMFTQADDQSPPAVK